MRPISPTQFLLSMLEGKDAESHLHIHAVAKQDQHTTLCIRHTQMNHQGITGTLQLAGGWLAADTRSWQCMTWIGGMGSPFCTPVFCLTIHKTPNSLALLVTFFSLFISMTFTFLLGISQSTPLGYWNCPFSVIVLGWLRCFCFTIVMVFLSYC